MHEWPCDAEFVYSANRSPTEQTSLHLGSVASALKVEEIPYEICLVITMNAEDSQVSRDREDWQQHFAKCNISTCVMEVGMKQESTGIMNGTAGF